MPRLGTSITVFVMALAVFVFGFVGWLSSGLCDAGPDRCPTAHHGTLFGLIAIIGGVPAAASLLLIVIDLTRRLFEWAMRT